MLYAMPSKSSPLDVLSCSLLKFCANVVAPVIARLANLSLQIEYSTGVATSEETCELPANFQWVDCVKGARVSHAGTPVATSTQLC